MGQKSAPPLWLHDIAAALGLLTRFPVALDTDLALERSARSCWAYPVVGFLLGGVLLFGFMIAMLLGIPPFVSTVLIVGLYIVLTGAMHLDGLADTADGLWGGWTAERRLEIMKDSHIGVYGVCAVGIALFLYIATLNTLVLHPMMALALIGSAAISRAGMVFLMHALPNARGGGLSQSVGKPPAQAMWIALGIGCGGTLGLGLLVNAFGAAILMIALAMAATLGCAAIARRKIKGQTGDILGATQQVSEIAMLIGACAWAY